MVKRLVLAPRYMEKFQCIGGECEDNCCKEWTIHLDKDIYNRYRQVKNPELRKIISKNIGRDRSSNNDRQYAKIRLDEGGNCPLISEDGLCKIQQNLGPDALSSTCKEYPRYFKKIDGGVEVCGTLSCPELSRRVLFEEEGIEFIQMEEDVGHILDVFDTEGHLFLKKPERYFWEIRMFSLTILQFRDYSLADRLIILGLVYNRIEKLEKEGRTEDIPGELDRYIGEINNENMDKLLSGFNVNEDLSIQLLNIITSKRFDSGVMNNEVYMNNLINMINGFHRDDGETLKDRYLKNRDQYLSPYLKERSYILENFLVNEFFRTRMPFKVDKNLWESYIEFCSMYILMRMHLIGIAGFHKTMDDRLINDIIYSFSRATLHSNRHLEDIVEFLKTNNMDSLAYMTILLKE